jgi:hypothetical protein
MASLSALALCAMPAPVYASFDPYSGTSVQSVYNSFCVAPPNPGTLTIQCSATNEAVDLQVFSPGANPYYTTPPGMESVLFGVDYKEVVTNHYPSGDVTTTHLFTTYDLLGNASPSATLNNVLSQFDANPSTPPSDVYDAVKTSLNLAGLVTGGALLGAGTAASVLAIAQPELAPFLVQDEVTALEAGWAILPTPAGFPAFNPGIDPPLPAIAPGGIVSPALAANFNEVIASQPFAASLVNDLSSLSAAISGAVAQNDLSTTYALQNEYLAVLQLLENLASQLGTDFSALLADMKAAGIPDVPLTQSELQAYIASLEANGFPSQEITYFEDLGLGPDQMNAITSELATLDLSGAPTSLYAMLTDTADLYFQLANLPEGPGTSVPEPSSTALVGFGLIGLPLLLRKRAR